MVCSVSDVIQHPERYNTHTRNDLREDLDAGDVEAIEYYKSEYIADDVYLYSGPITFKLMCEKYGLDFDTIYELYKDTDMSAQQFYNRIVKDII